MPSLASLSGAGDASANARPCVSTARSFALYLLVGLLSFAADFTVFSLFAYGVGLHPLLANGISRPLGGVVCFLVNKHWTFENQGRHSTATQFVRFWCVFCISFGLSEGLIWLFHDLMGWAPAQAKLTSEPLVVVFNYLSLRFWTFR